EPMQARGSIDALDPQRPERALPHLAVAIGVLPGLLYRLLGDANGVLAAAVIALGLLQHLAVASMAGKAGFHTVYWGLLRSGPWALSAVGQKILLHDLGVLVGEDHGSARVPDKLGRALNH